MKSWALTFSLWGLVVGLGASQSTEYLYKGDPDATAVIEHTVKTDFEASKKARVVEFYSPYCGGCRNFKPTYIAMAEDINAKYADIEVYAVSCAPFKEICNKHNIKGYPVLYAFPAGATEGTYLQKSSMGGSYDIAAIAETLNVKSSSTVTSTKSKVATGLSSKRTLAKESDDDSSSTKVTSTKKTLTTKKATSTSTTKKIDSDDEDAKSAPSKKGTMTAKKTLTKKADDSADHGEEKDESSDKMSVKENRQLDDEKDGDDKSTDKQDDEDDKSADKEDDKEAKSDDKEDDEEKSADKEDDEEEKSEDKDDEEEKSEDKDVKKSEDKDDEKSEDKDDEKSEDKDDEKSEDKDDEKSEDKDDEKSEDKDEQKSEDKDDTEDDKSEDDDKQDASAFRTSSTYQAQQVASVVQVNPPTAPAKVFTGNRYKSGRVPGAGASKAGLKQRDMDKWKAVMEQRKKMMEAKKNSKLSFLRPIASSKKSVGPGGKVTLKTAGTSGKTKLMRANSPGTVEFEERKKQILERIAKAKKKHGFPILSSKPATTTLVKKEMLPFKKVPVTPGLMRRGMEKVPVVKRIFRMSPEEELILDASLSFVTGLKHGIFMSNDALSDDKKEALKSWLDLLSVTLPPEWGLHALIDDLSKNLNFIAKNNDNLQKILVKHPSPRKFWSKSCDKKGTGGFSCGMWKLFHIVTVGVAEHQGGANLIESGLAKDGTRTFSPADSADVIREYMAHFFGCDDCRKHFLSQYDSCAFRRCDRLTDDVSSASADDWKQLALWMWEVHNDVNIRVADKKVDRLQKKLNSKHLQGAQTLKVTQRQEDEVRVLFPSLDDCIVCFDESGKWNEDSVFEYLERTYWDAPDAKFDRLLTYRKVEGEDPAGGGFIWIMMIIAIAIVVTLRRHVNNLSFKNNFQVASVMGVGNKISDVVAGKNRTA